MVAIWLPSGDASATGFGIREHRESRRISLDAPECPCSLANQGRNPCPIRDVPHLRESPVFIGTNARSVVAPTGFEPVFQSRSPLSLLIRAVRIHEIAGSRRDSNCT